jgi:alpha-D-xyloside xylohydrolase
MTDVWKYRFGKLLEFAAARWPAASGHAEACRRMFCVGVLAVAIPVCGKGADSPVARVQSIAPGIWRLHFGNTERFTPTRFRSADVDKVNLKRMPSTRTMPLDAAKISFQVSERGCSLQLPMTSGENIYGFGLHTELFDLTQSKQGQTGRRVSLKPTDTPENELGESHAPAPFYVSSKGYGVFVDTARFASFYTGDVAPARGGPESGGGEARSSTAELYRARVSRVKTMLVDVPAARGVDVYVFAGPTMLEAVERYNLFSGGGTVPPLWGLGVQYRGYTKYGAADTLALAARIRAAHMPCDVWGVEPGWQSRAYSCSFVWDTNRFPDPNGFLREMRSMGYEMNFWEHAFTHPTSPMFAELKPWSGDYLVWNGLVPDFSTRQARRIFLKQNDSALFDRNVESVKLDECDFQPDSATPWSFPLASRFPSGMDGEVMHSLFGLLYQQTMWEHYQKTNMRTWGLVRNSHALASPLPYVLYSDSYDARCYVRGVANAGFSGLLWTPEVRTADSIPDFYRRLETVVFSHAAVINAWFIPNPPWDQVDRNKNEHDELMPGRQAVAEKVRQLLQLRMRFIPYLYAAFNEYHSTGKPPIRALVLDWPSDAKTRQIDDEFMFGDSVLVAPMFAGETNRAVYLPSGDWFDFWTHGRITGGKTIRVTNGVEQIPLFVKSGVLLPLAEPVEFVKPDTCFEIAVNVIGEKPADFTLYEDDGVSTAYARGKQNQVKLHANGDDHSVQRSGNYRGPERYRISGWKRF